jgi:DNA repair exonuclease SbcCD ATPase subunit
MIRDINVKNLGPIDQFSVQFGLFNLIYGYNETGKTYLVEFLIRNLFSNVKKWHLRPKLGRGKITISGLQEEIVTFPTDGHIEDYLPKKNIGLPRDFSKLLVVKGAELELDEEAEGGVDKKIIKDFLSSKRVLDQIDERIPKTIQNARIEGGIIVGSRQADIKQRQTLEEQIDKIEELFEDVDTLYSNGARKLLEDEKQKLKQLSERLEYAKEYQAYLIDTQMKNVIENKSTIDDEKLHAAEEKLNAFKRDSAKYSEQENDLRISKEKSKDYPWLKSAYETYNSISAPNVTESYFLIPGVLIAAALTIVFAFLKLPVLSSVTLACAMLLGFFHLRKIRRTAKYALQTAELHEVKKEFKKRFNYDLTGVTVLKEFYEKLEKENTRAVVLEEQSQKDKIALKSLEMEISTLVLDLTGEKKAFAEWENTLKQLKAMLKDLDAQLQQNREYLIKLNIDPSDYKKNKPDTEYSEDEYTKNRRRLDEIETKLKDEYAKLDGLKERIGWETGDQASEIDWDDLLDSLKRERTKRLEDYRDVTARIIGQIAVHAVIEELRQTEDKELEMSFSTNEVQSPLLQITKKYKSIRLKDEALIVSSDTEDFLFSRLSRGAQEQILLALRIGFIRRLVRKESLFLILDDAFQYSDWQRREWMMDKMVELAKNGWQIIYFTMDDHIRDLFNERGKIFNDKYVYKEL